MHVNAVKDSNALFRVFAKKRVVLDRGKSVKLLPNAASSTQERKEGIRVTHARILVAEKHAKPSERIVKCVKSSVTLSMINVAMSATNALRKVGPTFTFVHQKLMMRPCASSPCIV